MKDAPFCKGTNIMKHTPFNEKEFEEAGGNGKGDALLALLSPSVQISGWGSGAGGGDGEGDKYGWGEGHGLSNGSGDVNGHGSDEYFA